MGGAEKSLTQLAVGLAKRGFQPEVYSLGPKPERRDALVTALSEAQLPVHYLGCTRWWQFWSAVRRLCHLFREQRPQCVQTFLFHANVVGALAARRAKVPVIFLGLRVAEPVSWRWRVQRWLASQIRQFVCVSESVASYACSVGGLPAAKLTVISNGIDLEAVDARSPADLQDLGIASGRQAIICVSRMDRQKGIDWLLDHAPALLQRLPDHELVLVGEGPYFQSAQRKVKASRLADRVHLLGWRDDVLEMMKAAHLFVLPSRWEGMSNALLEAMACQLPVVAMDVEGVREVVGPGSAEQVAPLGNSEEFLKRVVALAESPQRARRLGQQNRRHVAEHFSLQRVNDAYTGLYETGDPYH
jgi:starch synthase (maltosyl-transferring)